MKVGRAESQNVGCLLQPRSQNCLGSNEIIKKNTSGSWRVEEQKSNPITLTTANYLQLPEAMHLISV